MLVSDFSSESMRRTAHWATWLSEDWKAETPIRLHSGVGIGGSPEWHPDFARWMTRSNGNGKRSSDQRLRTTRVMRRLRNVAVREYEVAFRVLILGERLEDTTRWLNERAKRNSIPFPDHRPNGPHYIKKDAWALLIAAIDFARTYW